MNKWDHICFKYFKASQSRQYKSYALMPLEKSKDTIKKSNFRIIIGDGADGYQINQEKDKYIILE